jgi:hypothetical protein
MTRITGTLQEDLCTFIIISLLILLTMRNVSDKSVDKIKTRILCSVMFFPKTVPFMRECGGYGTVRQATDDNITAHAL